MENNDSMKKSYLSDKDIFISVFLEKIKKLMEYIIEKNKENNKIKKELNKKFDIQNIIYLISQESKGYIDINDLKKYFIENKKEYDIEILYEFIRQFNKENNSILKQKDRKEKLTIKYEDFKNCLIPLISFNDDDDENENEEKEINIFDLFEAKFSLIKKIMIEIENIKKCKYFSTYEAFINIVDGQNFLDMNNLKKFLGGKYSENDIIQLIYRLDLDNDGKITYDEFQDLFFPFQVHIDSEIINEEGMTTIINENIIKSDVINKELPKIISIDDSEDNFPHINLDITTESNDSASVDGKDNNKKDNKEPVNMNNNVNENYINDEYDYNENNLEDDNYEDNNIYININKQEENENENNNIVDQNKFLNQNNYDEEDENENDEDINMNKNNEGEEEEEIYNEKYKEKKEKEVFTDIPKIKENEDSQTEEEDNYKNEENYEEEQNEEKNIGTNTLDYDAKRLDKNDVGIINKIGSKEFSFRGENNNNLKESQNQISNNSNSVLTINQMKFSNNLKESIQENKNVDIEGEKENIQKNYKDNISEMDKILSGYFIDFIHKVVRLENRAENLRESLALCNDLTLKEIFYLFDNSKRNMISMEDFKEVCKKFLALFPSDDQITLVYKRYDLDRDKNLNLNEFLNMLSPLKEEYIILLNDKEKLNKVNQTLSFKSKKIIIELINNIILNESFIYELRARLLSQKYFTCINMWGILMNYSKGNQKIKKIELNCFLESFGCFLTHYELDILYNKFTKGNDCITYEQFYKELIN